MNGRPPVSWEELQSVTGDSWDSDSLGKLVKPTLRYAFVENEVELPGEGRIVIISRSPSHNQYAIRGFLGPLRGILPSTLQRYAVVVTADGDVHRTTIPEENVHRVFKDAGIPLPAADHLGPRRYEAANGANFVAWLDVVIVVMAFLGRRLWRICVTAWAWTPSSARVHPRFPEN